MPHSRGRIVLLTPPEDGHLPYVMHHLDEEPLIVDTSKFLQGKHLTYHTSPARRRTTICYMDEPIGQVRSVWYNRLSADRLIRIASVAAEIRQRLGATTAATASLHRLYHDLVAEPDSQYWSAGMPVEPAMQEYARSSLNRLSLALVPTLEQLSPDAFWVSRREAVQRAEHKPAQLVMAQRHGFDVPHTVTTSDPVAAKSFIGAYAATVVKPLAVWAPYGRDQYTTIISAEDCPDFTGLECNPHIFQGLVEPAFELRVSVVRDDVFAAVVEDTAGQCQRSSGVRDWRAGFRSDTFRATAFELPPAVRRRCIQLVRSYGLACGMLDLIVTHDGRYVFLEINPNGAWGFVEEATGQPIGAAVARLLMTGRVPFRNRLARRLAGSRFLP